MMNIRQEPQKEKRTIMEHGKTFEYGGNTLLFEVLRDEVLREPWKEHDGHGIVSDWTTRDKNPGELVLCFVGRSRQYYDVQQTTVRAKKDGWGLSDGELAHLENRLGRGPTLGEITAEAVRQDVERLRAWCTDKWYWVGVRVTLLKVDAGAPDGYFKTRFDESLWGIESDAGDYLEDVAWELAGACVQAHVKSLPKANKVTHIEGRVWCRKSGGCYTTARVYVDGELAIVCPRDGGSGDHYITLAVAALNNDGWKLKPHGGTLYVRETLGASYSCVTVAREKDL